MIVHAKTIQQGCFRRMVKEVTVALENQKELQHNEQTQNQSDDQTIQLIEDTVTESRSVYQKRMRDEEKQVKRKKRRTIMAVLSVFVILTGVLCGAVIASTMNTPHDAVVIASANAQYVKYTVAEKVDHLVAQLPWGQEEDDKNASNSVEQQDTSNTEHTTDIESDSIENKETTEIVENTENNDTAEADATEIETAEKTENTEVTENIEKTENTEIKETEEVVENTANAEALEPNQTENAAQSEQSTAENEGALAPSDNPYGIDPNKPMVALTFDDGPSQYTWPIVATLSQYNARGTFFLVGNRVATHQAAIDYTLANNQEIGSHSFNHANLAKCSEEELLSQIQRVDNVLHKQHDYVPTLFRVPYGERNDAVLKILREQGKPVIGWSVDPRDWEVQDKDTIVKHVLSHVKDGDIILMHDIYKPTADAVAELVPALQEQGYQLVTVSELLKYKGIDMVPGTYYYASWKWV